MFERGYGAADAELGVPNTPDMIYRIGSLTKPFTALGIMLLVGRGHIATEDPVCRFVAACPEEWRGVVIRHLLTHTSGIPDLFQSVATAPLDATRAAIDATITAKGHAPLLAPPGTRYAYSNFGYLLLGYVIEVVSREPWDRFLRETIFDPAGMHDTAYDDVWAVVPRRARGYTRREGRLTNIPYKDPSAFSAGGLQSTVRDLFAWGRLFFSGRLVPEDVVARMTTPGLGDYGFGIQTKTFFGRTVFNHTGGTDGFASHVQYYPREDVFVAVLSNVESESAKRTACDVASLLFGVNTTRLDTMDAPVDRTLRGHVVGDYDEAAGGRLTIEETDDALFLVRGASGRKALRALSTTDFVLDAQKDVTVTFDVRGATPELVATSCGTEIFRARHR